MSKETVLKAMEVARKLLYNFHLSSNREDFVESMEILEISEEDITLETVWHVINLLECNREQQL